MSRWSTCWGSARDALIGGGCCWRTRARTPSHKKRHLPRLEEENRRLKRELERVRRERMGKTRAARRMRQLDLRSIVRWAWRVITDSRHRLPVAPNLVAR